MKKFLVSLLAVLYLGMSSGIAMELHYCMGRLAGIEWFSSDNDRCGRCGIKEKKGGCCSDEYKFVKLQDAHKQTGHDPLKCPVAEAPAVVFHPAPALPPADCLPVTCHLPAPPSPPDRCVQAMLCIFRI